ERAGRVTGLVARPAEVVVERPQPVANTRIVRLRGNLDSASRPSLAVADDREHVGRIDRDHGLSTRLSSLERLLELRETSTRPAGRALPTPALEQHPRLGPAERFGIVEQRVALLESAAQTLD